MKKPFKFALKGKPAVIDLEAVELIFHLCDDRRDDDPVSIYMAGGQTIKIPWAEAQPVFDAIAATAEDRAKP